jgi:hypothetical protein
MIELILLADSLDWIEDRLAQPAVMIRALSAGIQLVAFCLVAAVGLNGYKNWQRYKHLTPFAGPEIRGVDKIRIDERMAATYQWLAANLIRNADSFASTIGLNSLSIWTGIPPSSKITIGNSLDLLSDEQQQDICQQLLRSPRSCVIYHPSLFRPLSLVERPEGHSGPLLSMVRQEFKSCGSVLAYDFCIRNEREVPTLVDCVRLETPAGPSEGSAVFAKVAGNFLLMAVPGQSASRLSVYDLDRNTIVADTRPEGTSVPLEIIAPEKSLRIGSSDAQKLDLSAPPPLTLSFELSDPALKKDFWVLRLIDQDGRVIKSIPVLKTTVPHEFFP